MAAPGALAAGGVLVARAPTAAAAAAVVVFAAASVTLFTVSALYHRGGWPPRMQSILRRADRAGILLLIAGTYTPFAVLALSGGTRVALLCVIWAGATLGMLVPLAWPQPPRWSYVSGYLTLGWTALWFLPQLARGAGVAALALVAAGGALYTAGGVAYGLRRPDPFPRWFGFHEVFHACTIAAFACQYIGISLLVYRAG